MIFYWIILLFQYYHRSEGLLQQIFLFGLPNPLQAKSRKIYVR